MLKNRLLISRTSGLSDRRKLWIGILLLLITFAGTPEVRAEGVVFVQSFKAAVRSEPKLGAEKLVEVERGAELRVLQEQQGWYQVSVEEKQGWISALLVAEKAPGEKVSFLAAEGSDLASGARRRASSFATAAAARGLSEDRIRASGGYWTDDMSLVETMEQFKLSEAEILEFHKGVEQ